MYKDIVRVRIVLLSPSKLSYLPLVNVSLELLMSPIKIYNKVISPDRIYGNKLLVYATHLANFLAQNFLKSK
jgi:hypothetical protein